MGTLAILSGCKIRSIFTPHLWDQAVAHFAANKSEIIGGDEDRTLFASFKLKKPTDPIPFEEAVSTIKKSIQKERAEFQIEGDNDDADVTKLALLTLFWDPVADRVDRFRTGLSGENNLVDAHVLYWAMTAHHKGYWFSNTFPRYEQALKTRLQKFVEKEYGIPAKSQTCDKLVEMAHDIYMEKGKVGERGKEDSPVHFVAPPRNINTDL